MKPNMQPLKPYLTRAYYDWICESQLTPYLLVQANLPHVEVPPDHVDKEDHMIVLNISPMAINKLAMNNKAIRFEARFDSRVFDITVPYYAVSSLYAFENDEGIYFEINEEEVREGAAGFETVNPTSTASTPQAKKKELPSYLRIVENDATTDGQ